jgi:hypothetical protein
MAFCMSASAQETVREEHASPRMIPMPDAQVQDTSARRTLRGAVEMCLHWGGEEPYDEERARQLAEGSERDCSRAAHLAREALARFPNDGHLNALALVLVGYHGQPSIADELAGDGKTRARRCDLALRQLEEDARRASSPYEDYRLYIEDACAAPLPR